MRGADMGIILAEKFTGLALRAMKLGEFGEECSNASNPGRFDVQT